VGIRTNKSSVQSPSLPISLRQYSGQQSDAFVDIGFLQAGVAQNEAGTAVLSISLSFGIQRRNRPDADTLRLGFCDGLLLGASRNVAKPDNHMKS
jgi:hypothetical protein